MARRMSRDELIQNGIDAKRSSEESMKQKGPWIYKYKCMVGNRGVRNIETECCNIPHLNAEAITKYAEEGNAFHVYSVQRVMKSNLRSRREDV